MRFSDQPYWFCIFSLPILPLIYKNIRNLCFFLQYLSKIISTLTPRDLCSDWFARERIIAYQYLP